jgi:rhodanese-related sulfurtransferase
VAWRAGVDSSGHRLYNSTAEPRHQDSGCLVREGGAKLSELDPEEPYALTCQVGLRGYIACRILEQHGFDAVNVSGGAASLRVAQS